ncbi:MAG: glutamine synthetase family protein [Pseudomonadota bacterium]
MGAELAFAGLSDFAGLMRGKGFLAADLDAKVKAGIGWTPTNVQITCFDTIAESPYGAVGDLVLMPNPETLVEAQLPDERVLRFLLGRVVDLDGAPWECCTRHLLQAALDRFGRATGLTVRATFEHEFMLPGGRGSRSFTLDGFEERQRFGEALHVALEGAGMRPDSFLREYGPDQMEITLPPADAMRAADEAVALREITRAVARAMDLSATFTPLAAPDIVGNGVHVHLSFWDEAGAPATHDPDGPSGLSRVAGAFAAGLLQHLNAVAALTAPSALSSLRLQPHRWSAAYNNLGLRDREAALRICPVPACPPDRYARRYHYEFRAADAAASPHLALAALVTAGTLGVEAGLDAPEATQEDLSLLSPEALAGRGFTPLPVDLGAALDALAGDAGFRGAFPEATTGIYIAHKRGEIAHVEGMSPAERFAAYAGTY